MEFTAKDVSEFKSLVAKGTSPQQAKEIIINSKQDKGGFTNAFLDVSANIYEWVENLWADIINIPLSLMGKEKIKPMREQLIPTGEEYKWGIVWRSVDTISQRWKELWEAIMLWGNEQSEFESGFQWAMKAWRGILDIGGDAFMSTLSTLTPNKQKEALKSKIQEIAETDWGEAALRFANNLSMAYNSFKSKNPRAWRNIDALGTLVEWATEIATWIVSVRWIRKWAEESIHLWKEWAYKAEEFIKKINEQKQQVSAPMEGKWTIASEMFQKEKRATEEISANILQPYKGMTEDLPKANMGLQRVIQESDVLSEENISFANLLSYTNQTLGKYGRMIDESLQQIKFQYKDDSITSALEQLEDVYSNVASKKGKAELENIINLRNEAETVGLNPSQINEVKILHTKANSLFNDKGIATGGFTSDDLRNIRTELKTLIENIAEERGITNIKDINKTYGEIATTKIFLENQVKNLKSYQWRQLPETLPVKVGKIIGRIPVISWGVRGALWQLGVSLRSDKINPIEVQKRLKKLTEELYDTWMEAGEVDNIVKQVATEIKAIPQKTSYKEAILTENQIIQESKAELVNTQQRLSTDNPEAESYNIANESISEINNPSDLEELKKTIRESWLVRQEELINKIDNKIQVINEMAIISDSASNLRGEYGDSLVDNFRELYRNELNLKTTKWGDKYTTIEFNETAWFKRFSDSAQEFINSNPWMSDMTVQDVYDELKAKMLNEDISALRRNAKLDREETIKVASEITENNITPISKKIASKLRTDDINTVRKTINEYAKKYGEKLKDYIWELIDEIAERVWARINLFSTRSKEFVNETALKGKEALGNKLDDLAETK